MDRRTFLAILLCFFIYFAWQKLYIEPRMPQPQTVSQSGSQTTGTPTARSAPPVEEQAPRLKPSAPVRNPIAPQRASVETATGTAVIGNGTAALEGWDLKSYRLGMTAETGAVDLKAVTHQTDGEIQIGFDHSDFAYLNDVRGNLSKTAEGVVWSYEDDRVRLVREIRSTPTQPYLDLTVQAEFKAQPPKYAFLSLNARSANDDPEAQDRKLVYFTQKSYESVAIKDSAEAQPTPVLTPVKYVGAASRYFLLAVLPQGAYAPQAVIEHSQPYQGRISLMYPISGKSLTLPTRVYFGPKELDLLRSVEPTLDHAVDFGWFTAFAYPLLNLLNWLHDLVKNYGVAIILLTLMLKIVTYPLTYKSMKSMKEMAKLQPQLQKLREKHKDDKEALNREMISMMKTHGYNPMAGCLPILIQMPIFFALYRVLYSSTELYHAPFALWIQDLSSRDPYYVTPVLLSLSMFLQQKLSPQTATDPAQQKMLQLMPLIFGAFMLTLPSGLTLYMLTNAIASIIQQLILNKKLDTGHVSAVAARAR